MRNAFNKTIIDHFSGSENFFLTGDLGFMALEGLRTKLGDRFINVGISEQNMIGVAAGLAREGFKVFVYSIAPFCYARPYEQIRNDICFNKLPVLLVGNGGGYAYGSMGPSHHALEDCAAMLALLGMRVFAPTFDNDLAPAISRSREHGPSYLRLGYEVRPDGVDIPAYAPWRQLLTGTLGILVALGPLAGLAWKVLLNYPEEKRPEVWAVTELPLENPPEKVLSAIQNGSGLVVIEEHVQQGGLGMSLLYALGRLGISPKSFIHKTALGYPSGNYGSQAFHRRECGLDEDSIKEIVLNMQGK
jgi:transketolase